MRVCVSVCVCVRFCVKSVSSFIILCVCVCVCTSGEDPINRDSFFSFVLADGHVT